MIVYDRHRIMKIGVSFFFSILPKLNPANESMSVPQKQQIESIDLMLF